MEFIIGVMVVGAFIGLIVFFLKKENNKFKEKNICGKLMDYKLKEMVGNLNEEQKNKLALTDVKFVEGKNDEWIQEGMIGEMKDKGYKYSIRVLWHNKVIRNATYDQLQYGDTSLSKKDVESNGLKVGDFVKVRVAPAKTSGCFKIIL